MPLNKKQRADLAEFVIAGGLTAMGFVTGQGALVILAGIVAGVGRSWTGNLARRSFQTWRDRWLTDAGVLHDDIAAALARALRNALGQMEEEWRSKVRSGLLPGVDRESAERALAPLRWLQEDANDLFRDTDRLGAALQRDDIRLLVGGDEAYARDFLAETVAKYFYGHASADFVAQRLPRLWPLCFQEELKDPGDEGTRAWRAMQRLWQSSLGAAVAQIQEEGSETLATVQWLKEWAGRLESLPTSERDLTGEAALDTALRPVRESLNELRQRSVRIEEGVRRVEDGVERVETGIEQLRGQIEGISAAPLPSPHHLPPDIADFTGRRKELGKVTRLLVRAAQARGTAVVISAVAGMAGVGKSALAIHAAHALKDSFPDATLYVNLRGADDRPVLPAEALAGFLRALGVDDPAMPKDLPGRSGLYRSLLDGQRALVLLDNAYDEAQVRPLLPGSPTCAVLVTSRARLSALEGAETLDLEVMPETDALSLLRKLAGARRVVAEPEAARRIVKLCGYLPLAIRIAGGKLRGKAHWTLAEYASRLCDQRGRLKRLKLGDLEVRASFAISYDDLDPADARLFRLLGLLVGPDFASNVAGALLEAEPAAAPEAGEEALERLVETQLLEAVGGGRYKFHDLMRLFACERLEEEETAGEQQAARLRCASFYLAVSEVMRGRMEPEARRREAQSISAATEQSLEEVERGLLLGALAWYDAERPNLLVAVEWGYQSQEWETVWRLAENLAPFFNLRAQWDDWERTHRMALDAAIRAQERSAESRTLTDLGSVCIQQGRWDEAIEMYQTSLQIKRELGDRHGEGKTLTNLGSVHILLGRWPEAIEAYEASRAIFSELGDRYGESLTLMGLGIVYRRQGRWDEAIEMYEISLRIKREMGDRHGEGQTLNNLGLIYADQGRWDEAIAMYRVLLAISRELGDRHSEARGLNNLGLVYVDQGRWDEAIDMYETSLWIERELGDRHGESATVANLGIVYAHQGRWDEAIEMYEVSLAIKGTLEDRHGEGTTLMNLGSVYLEQERWDEAIETYQASLRIRRELGDRHGESAIVTNLGRVYTQQGRWDEAIEMYQASLAISRGLGDRHGEGMTLANLGNLHDGRGQGERAVTLWREALGKLPPDSPDYARVAGWLEEHGG